MMTKSWATRARSGFDSICANGPLPCSVKRIATVPKTRSCRITKVVRSRSPAQIVMTISTKAVGSAVGEAEDART